MLSVPFYLAMYVHTMYGITKRELCAQPGGHWNAQDGVELLAAILSLTLNDSYIIHEISSSD